MRDFLALFVFIVVESSSLYFGGVFNKTLISLALVRYEMIIANERSWNNCFNNWKRKGRIFGLCVSRRQDCFCPSSSMCVCLPNAERSGFGELRVAEVPWADVKLRLRIGNRSVLKITQTIWACILFQITSFNGSCLL